MYILPTFGLPDHQSLELVEMSASCIIIIYQALSGRYLRHFYTPFTENNVPSFYAMTQYQNSWTTPPFNDGCEFILIGPIQLTRAYPCKSWEYFMHQFSSRQVTHEHAWLKWSQITSKISVKYIIYPQDIIKNSLNVNTPAPSRLH